MSHHGRLPDRCRAGCRGSALFPRLRSAFTPALVCLSSACLSIAVSAQSPSEPHPFATRKTDQPVRENTTPQQIPLIVPTDTPIRVALSERVRVWREGVPVAGKVAESVYAFDQPVIPAGSEVRGHVTRVAPITKLRRLMAMANSDFSPPQEYAVSFDQLILSDGRIIPLQTTVTKGTEQIVHLASGTRAGNQSKKKRSAAGQLASGEKQAIRDQIERAKVQIKSPGRIDRAKQFLLAQLPYRRQYLAAGTRFDADLTAPLDFGTTPRSPEQLRSLGDEIPPDSLLHARLVGEISSATAHQDTPIEAILTEPLFNANHQLVIAVNSRILGKVTRAKPARKLHHNGELRVVFARVTTPEGLAQTVQGNLSGLSVDQAANVKIDQEGGTRVTDSKSRYLLTGLSLTVAAFAARGDPDAPAGSSGINSGQATVAGVSGYKLVGAVVSLTARSRVFSTVLGGYGAATSVYSHFLSRGRDVVLSKDTAIEVAIGDRRAPVKGIFGN